MFAEAIKISVTLLMNNHMYEFNNNVYVQKGIGSLGIKFTGVAGEIYM